MKKFGWACIFSLFFNLIFAVQDGSQWIYSGFSPSANGLGYTGVSRLEYSGDMFLNPANPAFVRRFRLFGGFGIATPNYLFDLGISYPSPAGVLSVGVESLYVNPTNSVNSVMGFKLGFAKMIEDNFAFGFDVYGVNQAKTGVGGAFGFGLDVGAILKLKEKNFPTNQALALRHPRLGLTLTGLGTSAQLDSDTPLPGTGIRLGFAADFLDLGRPLKMGFEVDLTSHFIPLNVFGNVGLKITIADHLNLMGGFIIGNNGIGAISTNGIGLYTFGLSFDYQFNETPVEIFYAYNPYQFDGNALASHFIGAEIAFGLLDKKPPETKLVLKEEGKDTPEVYFSPNYDGSKDTTKLGLDVRDASLLKDWEVLIKDANGNTVKTYRGREERDTRLTFKRFFQKLFAKKENIKVPVELEWNGISDSGNILPDGKYTVSLKAMDELDNTGVSASSTIHLDNTPPTASLGLDYLLFSPNGDGKKDTVTINQNLSAGDIWKTEIRSMDGKIISDWEWKTNAPADLVWDGKDNKGDVVPDGSYDYLLYGMDRAGNRAILSVTGIKVSTQAYSIFLSLDKNGFSPNGDGVKDTLVLTPTVSDTTGMQIWKFEIKDKDDNTVWSTNGTDKVPEKVVWNGTRNSGEQAPDGEYKCSFSAEYENGNQPSSDTHTVILDTTPPTIVCSSEPELFSPDDDGENDVLTINMLVDDDQDVESWKMVIFDPDNKPFKTFEGKSRYNSYFVWDGRSDNGELVESAQDYKVKISAEDKMGNKIETDQKPIPVDVLVELTDRGLKIRISSIEFETGQANLSRKTLHILNRVAEILKKYNNYKVEVQGHTDNVGTEQINLTLSKQRAEAVKWYLGTRGINKNRMTTAGMAYYYPIADNETPEGKRKNRRVEFILIKDK